MYIVHALCHYRHGVHREGGDTMHILKDTPIWILEYYIRRAIGYIGVRMGRVGGRMACWAYDENYLKKYL